MTIEEQLASMPEPAVREWRSATDAAGSYRRLTVIGDEFGWRFQRTTVRFGGAGGHSGGYLRDGNHLAELWRWLVKGEQ